MSKLTAAIAAGILIATATASHADCPATVNVESPGHQALTLATDDATPGQVKASYNAAFAAARAEAIAVWNHRVRVRCPGFSAHFYRASNRHVEACDQAMGGRFAVCVSGRPGRKVLGL